MIYYFIVFHLFTFVATFSWNSCGSVSHPITITHLNITENDGKGFLLNARGELGVNITPPMKGSLEISKKFIWGWTKIPCYGSCDYEDLCALSPYSGSCPKKFLDNNIPCHCPIFQGSYEAKNFPLSSTMLPKRSLMREDTN